MCYWIENLLCGLKGDGQGKGDKNTKYFNSCATWRDRKNVIKGIRYEDSIWRVQPNAISIVLVNYYKTLFSSTEQRVSPNVLSCMPIVIDDEMNYVLCRDFGEHEVAAALQQMAPLKSPSSDQMPPLFLPEFLGYSKS